MIGPPRRVRSRDRHRRAPRAARSRTPSPRRPSPTSFPRTPRHRRSSPSRARRTCSRPAPRCGSLEAFVELRRDDAAPGRRSSPATTGIEVETHSALDPERLETSPGFFGAFAPVRPRPRGRAQRRPPSSTSASATRAEHRGPARAGERRGARPRHRASSSSPRTLEDDGNVDVERELLPLLGGEVAIGDRAAAQERRGRAPRGARRRRAARGNRARAGPRPLPRRAAASWRFTGVPYLVFVADDVDEEQARKTLAELQVPIAEALDPGEAAQAPDLRGHRDRGGRGAQPADLADRQPHLRDLRREARRRHRPGGRPAGQGGGVEPDRLRRLRGRHRGLRRRPRGGGLPQPRRPDRARRARGARRGPRLRAVRERGPQAPGAWASRSSATTSGIDAPLAAHGRAVSGERLASRRNDVR